MATDRRRDAATALTGAGLLGAGGSLRHEGVRQAVNGGTYPRVHLSALRGAKRGPKGLYVAGSALGLVGAAGLSHGSVNLVRRNVDKRDKTPLWQEGLAGTGEALRGRAESIKTPTPPKVRASQWGVAAAAGGTGSAVARALLRHRSGKAKALLAPIAGGLAATASIPVSNRVVRRQSKGEYVVTASGVRRAKDVVRKPSSKAQLVSSRNGPMRAQVVPRDERFGKSTSYRQQRAAITAAGSTPLIGPYAAAHVAAQYAPKGEKGKNAARQLAMGPVAGNAAGVGGAYAGAHLARHVTRVGDKAEGAMAWRADKINQVRHKVGLGPSKPAAAGTARHAARAAVEAHPLAKPLVHNRGTMAAAGLGFLASRAIVGTAGSQRAITLNQRDQSRHRVGKGLLESGATKKEKHKLASTKRTNAALAQVGGSLGLGSLVALGARKERLATRLAIGGSGIGGANSLVGARVQRREARAIDPVKKAHLPELPYKGPKHVYHPTLGRLRVHAAHPNGYFTVYRGDERRLMHRDQLWSKDRFKKDIGADHRDLIRRYGDRGPLPKGLARDEKMRAYEARVAAHGGKKGQKWQRRANITEGVRNVALGTGTVALAGLAHLKTKRGVKLAAKHPSLHNRLDHLALSSGAVGGAAELGGELARDRRASYSSSPGGVAQSALTRLKANTPGGA